MCLFKTGSFFVAALPDLHKLVTDNGKHIAFGEQHELMTHTDVFVVQLYVTLSHRSKIEHTIPGAQ